MEFWTLGRTSPATIAVQAARAEADGWTGMLMPDTQSVIGDCYVALASAALATTTLQIGTGVTNPYTRHAAVTASAIGSLHVLSRGRAVLGIGRGDSALAHLGLAPASPAVFDDYVDTVQCYLRGEAVQFTPPEPAGPASIDTIPGAGHPEQSQLKWLATAGLPKVPVDIAASGPKVIAIAARRAERVSFSLGADPERLRWAIDVARTARADAGLSTDGLSFGAYVNLVPHPDRDVARSLASVGVTTFSRFSVMHGKVTSPVGVGAGEELQRLSSAYDLRQHGASDADHRSAISAEYIDNFAIVGTPDECVERLQSLAGLGIDRVLVLRALAAPSDDLRLSDRLLADEVIPGLAVSAG